MSFSNLELAFWSAISLEAYLAQPRCGGKGLVLPQRDMPELIDFPWEAFPSLRSGRVVGWEEGEESGMSGDRGNWDWYTKLKKIVLK